MKRLNRVLPFVLSMTLLFLLPGCQWALRSPPKLVPPPTSGYIMQLLSSLPLSSLLVVAVCLGIFAGLNGIKAGWMGAAAALAGICIQSALSVTWVYIMCGLIFVGVVLIAGASVLVKNTALKEIITGVQKVKDVVGSGATVSVTPDDVNKQMAAAQVTPTTLKLVQKYKDALKAKGVI